MLDMLQPASNTSVSDGGDCEPPPGGIDRPVIRFDQDVPEEFLRQTVVLLFEHYGRRESAMASFPAAEAHDLWPVYRRAAIERDWRQLSQDFGLNGSSEPNTKLNHFHTVVSCGLTVVTQSYVEVRGMLPRPAEFRSTLARSCQWVLFASEPAVVDPSARMYAILTHGYGDRDVDEPGFADILIPAMDGERVIIAEHIRLFEDRFPELVAQLRAQNAPATPAVEEIEDLAEPKLHPNEGTGG